MEGHVGISALIQRLSDAERAQIGIAALEYFFTGTTTQEMPPALSLAFEMIKDRLSAKDNRGGRRPGAGRPKIKKNQNNSKKSKSDFDFHTTSNTAETQDQTYTQSQKNDISDTNSISPTPPLLHPINNNCNIINNKNNINTSTTRARKNSDSEKTLAADLFSRTADAPQKQSNQSKKSKFTPPTVEMVAEYCAARKNGIDPQHFVDHYATRNWIPKGSTRQMTDWHAAVRTWERTGFSHKIPPGRVAAASPANNPFAILDTPTRGT